MTPAITVVGSLNMDFLVRTQHLPAPGETVLGSGFQMLPGGKGANQAYAAGRLARAHAVRMVGRVGYDIFADQLKASLAAAGVDVSYVFATRAGPTGIALISVDERGQNTIVVASGANNVFAPAEVESSRGAFRAAAVALFQLETPLATAGAAMRIAKEEGARTMLDPAPAQPLSRELLQAADLLTPNESEACLLLGRPVARVSIADAPELARAVLGLGVPAVVLKLGDAGCYYADAERQMHSRSFAVTAVDATAAGDTFNAALAVVLAEQMPLEDALRFANAAAAISVTRAGAQASAPARAEVEKLLGS